MAVNTWVGEGSGTDTSWAEGSNWSEGTVPDADDDVVIANVTNDPIIADGTNPTINSLLIESGGHLTAGNNNITIDGHPASGTNRSIDLSGTFVKGTSTLTFTYSAAETKYLNFRGVEVHNVVINGANTTFAIGNGALTATGYVQVTAGTLDTFSAQNNALTVTGKTTIAGTLLLNSSTVNLGTAFNTDYAISMNSNGTFNGGSAIVSCGGIGVVGVSTATFIFSSVTTTITIANGAVDRFFSITSGTITHNSGEIIITGPSSDYIQWDTPSLEGGSDTGPYDLTINHASTTIRLRNDLIVLGELQVTAGTFTTNYDVGDNKDLTVTGDCDVTGALTLNDSAVAVGALQANSGAAITQGSSGTLEITTGSNFGGSSSFSFKNSDGTSDINLGGTLTVSGGTYFQPRTAPTYASVLNNVVANVAAYWVDKITIGGYLTVNASHKWQTYGGSDSFIVDGDVTLNGTLAATSGYLAVGSTGEMKFGSLTINGGGKYDATPLTTTITNKNGSNYIIQIGGLFTHNGGTVKIDTSVTGDKLLDLIPSSGVGLNNLIVNEDGSGVVQYNGNTTIAGYLTIEEGIFQFYDNNNSNLTIEGDVDIESGGQLGAAGWAGAGEFGSLTIASGGTYQATSGTTTITSETSGGKAYENDGTFTHNNGTLLLHADIGDTEVYAGSSSLYNLTSSTGNNVWLKENITIANDLTVTSGTFGSGGGNNKTVTVYGNAFISGGQLGNGSETGAYTVKGLVTLTGGTFDLSSGTVNLGGIRNAGGTIA